MKKTFLAIILLAITANFAIAQPLSRYELDVKDFTELKVFDGVNVNYVCNPDSVGRAVFIATDELASALMFNNTKGRLEIQVASKNVKISLQLLFILNFLPRLKTMVTQR